MFKINDKVRTNEKWNRISDKKPISGIITSIKVCKYNKTEDVHYANGMIGRIFTNEIASVILVKVDDGQQINECYFELDE